MDNRDKQNQSFFREALVISISNFAVKIIGVLFKIPLTNILGESMGAFNAAYSIYAMLYMVSTAGLPVAMSRMISNASTLQNYNQVRRIYKTSQIIFIALGLASSLLMVLGSGWLAKVLEQPGAQAAILCLGPCALIAPRQGDDRHWRSPGKAPAHTWLQPQTLHL